MLRRLRRCADMNLPAEARHKSKSFRVCALAQLSDSAQRRRGNFNLQSFSARNKRKACMRKAPKQCRGICASGKRCSITSRSTLKDKFGHIVAATLQSSHYCLFHLELFRPALLEKNARIFYLDFETSGLGVCTDNIVEIGLLENDGARFQTVVCPSFFIDSGQAVHGISNQ